MIDNENSFVLQSLEEVLGQIDANEGRRASHARKVVGQHVASELEMVHKHGCHGWRWGKAAARNDDDIDLHNNIYVVRSKKWRI